jgi:hypothetical protein
MPLELLLDRIQAIVKALRFGMQPDKFGYHRCKALFAQSCCVIFGDRCGKTWDTVERRVAHHSLILWDQSTAAIAGAIKLRRALWTQARAILRVHSQSN